MWDSIVWHPGNDVNSLVNSVSVTDGRTVVAGLNLLIFVSFILNIFASVICSFCFVLAALREKCPNTEFFLVCISPHSD